MAKFCVIWTKFTVHKKHDIDRDAPYLWVFGILLMRILCSQRNLAYASRAPTIISGASSGKGCYCRAQEAELSMKK